MYPLQHGTIIDLRVAYVIGGAATLGMNGLRPPGT